MTHRDDHNASTVDGRTRTRHGQQPYVLPTYATLAEWQARAAHLRRRLLVSAGLWPTPERCSLNPRVTGRIEHGDYTIENVFFESWPGFYVCGNLYRPKMPGPHPGLLCPHGHWSHGRLHDEERGSVPARCITFARQGYAAFAYDMVGYNDSGIQIAQATGMAAGDLGDGGPEGGAHRGFFHGPRESLWGISLLGLQLWNSVRALDFLESLPGVDPERLGCTGASGGGTQTFLLAAIDDRVQVAAPVNMISAHFQGGCDCENAACLRLDGTNVEFGAMMAPRPLLMVSATGDWTANTPQVEFPAVQAIYRLYGAEERVATVQVDAEHNYNRESREAVYAWFGRWLLGEDLEGASEPPYQLDPPQQMRVFASPGDLPTEAVTPAQLIEQQIKRAEAQIEALRPRDEASLHAYRQTMGVAYRDALNVELPDERDLTIRELDAVEGGALGGGVRMQRLVLGRTSVGERTPALLYAPVERAQGAVLVVHSEGKAAVDTALVESLLAQRLAVLTPDVYGSGELGSLERDRTMAHFTCFNPTDAALHVQDVLTALATLRALAYTVSDAPRVALVGLEGAGLWCLLARALAGTVVGRTVADAGPFACADDDAWIKSLYLPLLRRAGDLRTAVALSAPGPLWIYHAAPSFPTAWCRDIYRAAGAQEALRVQSDRAEQSAVVAWLTENI
jgi:dienelactone hydrolase